MVAAKKKELVEKLTQMIKDYPVVGLVNMRNLPTRQLQNMRRMLLEKGILILMTRKRLLGLALKNSGKKNIEKLAEMMKGMPALMFSKENPFILYSILQKNKSSAPAKAGQEAPRDIMVPAGPTNFAPGPIISELASVGIKTKVEEGKLTIVEDAQVAKEGEVISGKLAETLKRLDIQPMEIGLDLVGAWEKDLVFEGKQLMIDEEEYLGKVISGYQEAFNLAMEIGYVTGENVELLLQKAFREAKEVALEGGVLADEVKEEVLAKVEREAVALKEEAKIEAVEKARGEVKVEEKAAEEEKKEEAPVEEEKKEEVEEKKEEEKPVKEVKEEAKEEPVEEKKEEEKVEEEAPMEEPKVEEEVKKEEQAPEPVEKPKEKEKKLKEEVKTEEAKEKEIKEEKSKELSAAEKMIEETKKRFAQEEKEKKEEIVEVKISAEEMVKATREEFDPSLEKETKPSAEELVEEEKEETKKEINPQKIKDEKEVEEAESLFEKLKKQGTLREEKS